MNMGLSVVDCKRAAVNLRLFCQMWRAALYALSYVKKIDLTPFRDCNGIYENKMKME